eukprot:SRR837773.1744.p1 GENE.SRR837773.1744~~SRR837773.1744.p1  ORF type:complete len:357 (-),score=142.00 SRR837773.1744:98-1168(-)
MNYQKYMQSGQGSQAGGSNFDYSKYMQGAQGGQAGGSPFDYSKYMQGGQGQAGQAGGSSFDYSQYMQGGAQMQLSAGSSGLGSAADCNTTAQLKVWRENQLNQTKFIPKAYRHFPEESIHEEYEKNLARITGKAAPAPTPPPPASAKNCTTVAELKAWRAAKEEPLKAIPKAYRGYALKPIEKEYKENLLRIEPHAADEEKAEKKAEKNPEKKEEKVPEKAEKPKREAPADDKPKDEAKKEAEKPEREVQSESKHEDDAQEKAPKTEEADKESDDKQDDEPASKPGKDDGEDAPVATSALAAGAESTSSTPRHFVWMLPAVAGMSAAVFFVLGQFRRRRDDADAMGTPFLLLDAVA